MHVQPYNWKNMKRSLISQDTKDKLLRLFLRALPIPFIPAPELYDLVRGLKASQGELDRQVIEAIESLKSSSELISKLENGLQERADKLSDLRTEYERYTELAEIEEEKVAALVKQLELTLGKSQSKERWVALGINLFAGLVIFVLGVIFSDPLKAVFDNLWFFFTHK